MVVNPILVVDDNEQIVDILSQYIKKEGWPMLAARTGEEALDLFDAAGPSLILLDITQPSGAARSALIDALTEGCAGTIESLLQAGRMTRLPLELSGQGELAGQGMESFDAMRRALAAAGYNRQDDFARVLLLASPRMRRTGSVAVFSTRLTPSIADAALALSRMGARMRYTLVTAGETTEEQDKLLNLLRVSGVETLHVKAG